MKTWQWRAHTPGRGQTVEEKGTKLETAGMNRAKGRPSIRRRDEIKTYMEGYSKTGMYAHMPM